MSIHRTDIYYIYIYIEKEKEGLLKDSSILHQALALPQEKPITYRDTKVSIQSIIN